MSEIEEALKNVKPGLNQYLWLQKNFVNCNVAHDRNFQRAYNLFYRITPFRNKEWQAVYYELLEDAKTNNIYFAEALRIMKVETGNYEASFVSKLIATIHTEKPVIDKHVLQNLNLRLPYTYAKDREQKLISLYETVDSRMKELISSSEGQEIIAAFDNYYPDTPISTMKKVDLVLWQLR